MKISTYKKTALVLSLMGVAFSGYLSGVKLFSGLCAFSEPCPYFLGYPACWFGFAMFFILLLISIFALVKNIISITPAVLNSIVSGIGVIFAGYFAMPEITRLLSGEPKFYSLGLPTCTYGFIFFVTVFVVSIIASMTSGARSQIDL